MRRSRLASAVLALVLAASCARGSGLTRIPPESLPEDLYARPSPAAPVTQVSILRVWFVELDRLAPTTRQVIGPRNAYETAMTDLLAGPTPEEVQRGMSSAIPREAEFLGVEVEGGVATVDLSNEFERGADQRVIALRLGQVVFTLTELPRVSRVAFEIDGQPVTVIGDDGSVRERPVGREDYAALS